MEVPMKMKAKVKVEKCKGRKVKLCKSAEEEVKKSKTDRKWIEVENRVDRTAGGGCRSFGCVSLELGSADWMGKLEEHKVEFVCVAGADWRC
jgi:hypothetical protein